MSVSITVDITREDIIKLVQEKATARGLDVSIDRLETHKDAWAGGTGLQYGIHVETVFDGFPDEDEETTLSEMKGYFSPVTGLSVTMRPAEVN